MTWVLISTVWFGIAEGADGKPGKRLLMLSTGSRFSIGFPIVEQNLIEKLRQLYPGDLEFYSEYLDIIRFPSAKYHQVFRNYLQDKYTDDKPDLIILIYVGNLSVAATLLEQIFPGVSVVAVGLTEEELPPGSLGNHLTGIAQRSDPGGTINTILRLQPEIRRVVVIGGTAEVDVHVMNRAYEASRAFAGRIEFEFWRKRSMEDILKAVTSLPPQTAILFTRMFRDGAGRAVISTPAAQSIAKVSNAPVYAMSDSMFGTGAVGGSAADIAALGQRGGELAHQVLGGAEPSSLPFQTVTQGTPIFDWRALKRWSISDSRLPPGSVVRFKPQSTWEQYRWYILGALAIIALQTAMIADLLLHRRRRQRAEAALLENRQLMELATEAGGIGLWVRDLVSGKLWANPRVRSVFGFAKNDVLGVDDFLARVRSEDRAQVMSVVERAQEEGTPFDVEFRTSELAATPERWIAARGQLVRGPQGQVLRRMGTMIDITERKQAEDRLRESEENFRRLVETTAAVIWQADMQSWMFTYVGPQAVKLLGYPLEQWYEKDFWVSHIHPDDRARAVNTCLTMSKTAQEFEFEYRMVRMSGEVVWVHDIVNCQQQVGKPMQLRGLMLDITQRKQAEERFRLAVEASPTALVMVNQQGEILLVNAQMEKLFGYSREEITGQSVDILVPERYRKGHPVHRMGFFASPQTRAMGAGRDLFARRKDGSEFLVEIGLNPIETREGILVLTGIVDITERKRAESELQRSREELLHVTRTSTMGELTASLAHELNQPLTAILSNTQAAQRFLSNNPANVGEVREILADIVQDNTRASEVIRRIRALVKKEDLELAHLGLLNIIRDVVQLVHSDAVLRNVRVSLQSSPEFPLVRGDKVQLQQVILNLLLNAFDAMKDCPMDEREVSVQFKSNGADVVEVAVRDRGIGLTGDVLDKIFQPFFTTKREGLGMGLSISRSIIEAHGGKLWAENNVGSGATFYFTLPVETRKTLETESA